MFDRVGCVTQQDKLTYQQFREINCFPILHDDIALK